MAKDTRRSLTVAAASRTRSQVTVPHTAIMPRTKRCAGSARRRRQGTRRSDRRPCRPSATISTAIETLNPRAAQRPGKANVTRGAPDHADPMITAAHPPRTAPPVLKRRFSAARISATLCSTMCPNVAMGGRRGNRRALVSEGPGSGTIISGGGLNQALPVEDAIGTLRPRMFVTASWTAKGA
jgi:hypothetical protein